MNEALSTDTALTTNSSSSDSSVAQSDVNPALVVDVDSLGSDEVASSSSSSDSLVSPSDLDSSNSDSLGDLFDAARVFVQKVVEEIEEEAQELMDEVSSFIGENEGFAFNDLFAEL